jgi:hypothetical protein
LAEAADNKRRSESFEMAQFEIIDEDYRITLNYWHHSRETLIKLLMLRVKSLEKTKHNISKSPITITDQFRTSLKPTLDFVFIAEPTPIPISMTPQS